MASAVLCCVRDVLGSEGMECNELYGRTCSV